MLGKVAVKCTALTLGICRVTLNNASDCRANRVTDY